MRLSGKEKDINVQHRLARANETLKEAKDLLGLNWWRGAANRLYYACYYAVTALLLKRGYMPRTHDGAKRFFERYFIITGIFSDEQNMLYGKLFDLRQNGDNSDWIKEENIKPLFEPAEKFIEAIENLIKKDL